MTLRIHSGDIHLIDLNTRMPFKYGIATMTNSPHAFVRLHIEIDGQRATGIAADHLPPKWFTKDPNKAIALEVAEMARVIEQALVHAAGISADSPFHAWQQVWEAQHAWGEREDLPPLLTHFGTSLVERSLIEAACRHAGLPFASILRNNRFGIRLGDIHRDLGDAAPGDFLPERPLSSVIARHTVGMADPLTDDDIAAGERLADGLPQSLTACVQTYGLRHFKVKLSGQVDADRQRVGRVAGVIAEHGPADYAFSLDGNEQFRSVDDFQSYWQQLRQTPELQAFFDRLLFVEQPMHRDVALNPETGSMTAWQDRPAMIIDESDADLGSLPMALQLGYAGTSHKNCKGVFKGIANACLLSHLQRQGQSVIMSGEDLANIGPVALLQDLAVCASLGVASVERNGHHYFAGLSMFPTGIQKQVQDHHGDLYHASAQGWPTLRIAEGKLATKSVVEAPFGITPVIDVEQFSSLPRWREERVNTE